MGFIGNVRYMIKQSKNELQNLDDSFFKMKKERADILNKEFFQNIDLTDSENDLLTWVCGLDYRTFDALSSVFKKVRSE